MADAERVSSSAWTLHRSVDFKDYISVKEFTPKEYQWKFNNCSTNIKARITEELIKHISSAKLLPCLSKLFNSQHGDLTLYFYFYLFIRLMQPREQTPSAHYKSLLWALSTPLPLWVLLIVFQRVFPGNRLWPDRGKVVPAAQHDSLQWMF